MNRYLLVTIRIHTVLSKFINLWSQDVAAINRLKLSILDIDKLR